ncbi:MAG: fibronectin type III domain-containing protein [Chitinophagales bacterium]|nr:fibronectin type III domain-containing protein [Chitinophagales bacterium]
MRYAAVGFNIGEKAYLGTGSNDTGLQKDWWEYDPTMDSWSQKMDLSGVARRYAVGFSIGSYGYIGTGDAELSDNLDDFWQYDPASNSWTQKADFAGGKRWFATGFSIGDKGYMGTGYNDGFQVRKDFYEYDPATDTWTQIADCSGKGRLGATSFAIGDKGYVGCGTFKDWWEYDPATGVWTKKANLPGNERDGAVGFSINGKGYVGTGEFGYTSLSDFWQYDPATDQWTQLEDFAGGERRYAVGFAVGEKGYVGTGWSINGDYLNDFWEFTPPGCAAPGNLTTTNISPSSAKLKWDGAGGAEKYKVQYKADSTGATWISKTVKAANNSLTIAGLTPNTPYKWKVRSICGEEKSEYSATETFTTLLRTGAGLPAASSVSVYPNPVCVSTVISIAVPASSTGNAEIQQTAIGLYDLAGKLIRSVLDENLVEGEHKIILNRGQLASGIYFLHVQINDQVSVLKIAVE